VDLNYDAWLYTTMEHLLSADSRPQVMSISYGYDENLQCDITYYCESNSINSIDYSNMVNLQFQKAGILGISVIVSSGDSGAHSRSDNNCTTPLPLPQFPASSPYVTSVGATQLSNFQNIAVTKNTPKYCGYSDSVIHSGIVIVYNITCINNGTEQAVSYDYAGFNSGGGFSNLFTRPITNESLSNHIFNQVLHFPTLTRSIVVTVGILIFAHSEPTSPMFSIRLL